MTERDPIRAWTTRGTLTHAVIASTDQRAVCGVRVTTVAVRGSSAWQFRTAEGNVCPRCRSATRLPDDPPIEPNQFEQEKRASKAYRLARAARALMREAPSVTIDALEVAPALARHRLALLAGVKDPSDATWAVMVGLLKEMLANDG